MNSSGRYFGVAVTLASALMAAYPAWNQDATSTPHHQPKDRARIVLAQALPKLDGDHLNAALVEVNYGLGEKSLPHSHPCAVVAYVVEGAIRTQVKGEPEKTYKAGDSFYEAPNGVHLVSANASSTAPAKLVAYLICDHDAPLSVAAPQSETEKEDNHD